MDFDEYQVEAGKTAIYPKNLGLIYTILGLASESGELAGKYSKVIRDNNGVLSDEFRSAIISELGDVLWFVAMVATELEIPLEDVASMNIEKLADRQNRNVLNGSGDNR